MVYGLEEELYLLPTFLTRRIYYLDYIRKRLVSNHLHFVIHNKATTFKLHQKIGPFAVKSRTTKKIVEDLLKDLNFP